MLGIVLGFENSENCGAVIYFTRLFLQLASFTRKKDTQAIIILMNYKRGSSLVEAPKESKMER